MPLKLRRALYLFVGLSSTACSDLIPEAERPNLQFGDASTGDGFGVASDAGADGQSPPADPRRSLRMVSMPPSYVVAGETYRYRVKTNGSRSGALELIDAPAGMTVRGPMLEWTPTAEQATASRTHLAKLRVTGDTPGVTATQELRIAVAKATLAADSNIDAALGGSVYGGSKPEATRLRGVGVYVPPRSVTSTTRVSVSELDVAPAMPNSAGTTRAVRFGPLGQLFETPARVTLPMPREVAHAPSRLGVYVYDPAGRWQRVPMVAIDAENGLVTARAQHFSVYAAMQSSLDLEVSLGLAGNRSLCSGALIGRSVVTSPLAEIDLDTINNLPAAVRDAVPGAGGSEATVLDLLMSRGFTGSLRTVQVLELVEQHGFTEVPRDQRTLANTLYVAPDGSATVTHTDALGNVIDRKQYATPQAQVVEIASRLSGAATDVVFAGINGASLGLAARTHMLYFTGDASLDPVGVDDLGIAAVERAPTFAAIGPSVVDDIDCDGLLTAFDPTDDSLIAAIEASPSTLLSLYRGEDAKLQARVLRGEQTRGAWSLLDAQDATLAEIPGEPDARRFSANAAGRYLVSFRALEKGRTLEHVFAVDVAERVANNTPPRCQPSKELETARVGEAVALSALVVDAESRASALRIEWGLVAPSAPTPMLSDSSMLDARGDKALFAPLSTGNYLVGCRAYDGETYGPVGTVKVGVVGAAENRAPVDVTLTPAFANIAQGARLKLQATAHDPDGDALSFTWTVDGASLESEPESKGALSLAHIVGDEAGIVDVSISVSDGKAAPLTSRVQVVVGAAPSGTLDQDQDGWPAGEGPLGDCNDADVTVFPGAREQCGENLDRNCDGSIRLDDCDYDDQTVAAGDCDDTNPLRKLGLTESCDNLDNNCNGDVDEGFAIGKTCSVGQGECLQRGQLVCSADAVTSICSVTPLPGSPEKCDGVDNDCDGVTDPAPVCSGGASDGGTTPPPDAGVPDGGAGACVYQGPEICGDGVDNDCDALLDERDDDCTAAVIPTADSCIDVRTIALNKPVPGDFAGAKLDFSSRCGTKPASTADRVYGFQLLQQSTVYVRYTGAVPYSWSIQEGTCSAASAAVSELTCGDTASGTMLKPGEYFLVIRGVSGMFDVVVSDQVNAQDAGR
jgi:hypothetical protein